MCPFAFNLEKIKQGKKEGRRFEPSNKWFFFFFTGYFVFSSSNIYSVTTSIYLELKFKVSLPDAKDNCGKNVQETLRLEYGTSFFPN